MSLPGQYQMNITRYPAYPSFTKRGTHISIHDCYNEEKTYIYAVLSARLNIWSFHKGRIIKSSSFKSVFFLNIFKNTIWKQPGYPNALGFLLKLSRNVKEFYKNDLIRPKIQF